MNTACKRTPIVVAHFYGAPRYLTLCLQKASALNDVILIGDNSNKGVWPSFWNSDTDELSRLSEFWGVYKKLSTYEVLYEQSFWKRIFAIEQWFCSTSNTEIILIDSDVLVFSDLETEVIPRLKNKCLAGLITVEEQTSYEWSSSCHFSYWSKEGISSFADFCLEAYSDKQILEKLEEKWAWHCQNKIDGGICEMTLLYLWQQRHAARVENLTKVVNGTTIDQAISSATNRFTDEFYTENGLKKIWFVDGKPFAYNKKIGTDVRFIALHCQGGDSKQLISVLANPYLYRFYKTIYMYISFKGRLRSAIKALTKKTKRFIICLKININHVIPSKHEKKSYF